MLSIHGAVNVSSMSNLYHNHDEEDFFDIPDIICCNAARGSTCVCCEASGVSLEILEQSTPKTRVCLLYCFVLSPLTLLGAVPHHHLALSVRPWPTTLTSASARGREVWRLILPQSGT